MNLLEFKRRLMTEPGDRSPGMRAARAAGGEFAEVAAESDRFERALVLAARVPTPAGLADRIILQQSLEGQKRTMRWAQWGSIAAVLAIAVAVTAVVMNPATSLADLERHVAWHWQHDGPQVLAASMSGPEDPDHVQEILSGFGVQLAPEILKQVRLSKYCPTPDGKGAHLVLDGPEGPVTVYYMPRTRLASSPATMSPAEGMQAVALNLERGSIALIAPEDIDLRALAAEIRRHFAVAPGTTI